MSEMHPAAHLFIACARLTPRAGRSYDEWLNIVTRSFKAAYNVIERGPGSSVTDEDAT